MAMAAMNSPRTRPVSPVVRDAFGESPYVMVNKDTMISWTARKKFSP